jgi:hypothetical protein
MSDRRLGARPAAAAPVVHTIDARSLYFPDTLQAIFRLRKSTIRREWKAGRLRISKRAGRYYVLGEWILEWLRGGEIRPSGKSDL